MKRIKGSQPCLTGSGKDPVHVDDDDDDDDDNDDDDDGDDDDGGWERAAGSMLCWPFKRWQAAALRSCVEPLLTHLLNLAFPDDDDDDDFQYFDRDDDYDDDDPVECDQR